MEWDYATTCLVSRLPLVSPPAVRICKSMRAVSLSFAVSFTAFVFYGNDFGSRLKKSNKIQLYADIYLLLYYSIGFGGLGVAFWPLVPKFAGSNPAEAFLRRGSRFAACKRSLNLRGSRNVGKITTGHLSRPQFHLSLLGSLASLRTEAPGG